MFQPIENLREKPERTKKLIAFTVAFCVAGVIFIVWLTVIWPDFQAKQERQEHVASLEPSPIATFASAFSHGFSEIGQQFSDLKTMVANVASARPEHYSTTTLDVSDTASTTVPEEPEVGAMDELPAQN